MGQLELQHAYKKARAALDELGRVIEAQAAAPLPRRPTVSVKKLCEAILREKPGLSIYEIMEELRKRGYEFIARNPLNSVRTMLYSSPEFTCKKGQFSLRDQKFNGEARPKNARSLR